MEKSKAWLKERQERLRGLEKVVSRERFADIQHTDTSNIMELEILRSNEKEYNKSIVELQEKMASCYVLQKQKKKNAALKIKQERELNRMKEENATLERKNELIQNTIASVKKTIGTTKKLSSEFERSHNMYIVREELIHQDKLVRLDELKGKASRYVSNIENSKQNIEIANMRKNLLGLKIKLMMTKAEQEDLVYMANKFKEIAVIRRNVEVIKIAQTMTKINRIKKNKLETEKNHLIENDDKLTKHAGAVKKVVDSELTVDKLSHPSKIGANQSIVENSSQNTENWLNSEIALGSVSPNNLKPNQPTSSSVFDIFKLPSLSLYKTSCISKPHVSLSQEIMGANENLVADKVANINTDTTGISKKDAPSKTFEVIAQKIQQAKVTTNEITASEYFMKKASETEAKNNIQENVKSCGDHQKLKSKVFEKRKNNNTQKHPSKLMDKINKVEKMQFVKPIISTNIPKPNQEEEELSLKKDSQKKIKENASANIEKPQKLHHKYDDKELTKSQNHIKTGIPKMQSDVIPQNIKDVNKGTNEPSYLKRSALMTIPVNNHFNINDISTQKHKPTAEIPKQINKNQPGASHKNNDHVKYPRKEVFDVGNKNLQSQPIVQKNFHNANQLKRKIISEKNETAKKVQFDDGYLDIFNITREENDTTSDISFGSAMSDDDAKSPFNFSQNGENRETQGYAFSFNPVPKNKFDTKGTGNQNEFGDILGLF